MKKFLQIASSRRTWAWPYVLFLVLFVVLPLLLIVVYAFTTPGGDFTLHNFVQFFTTSEAVNTFIYSIAIAILTTAICLLLGYPAAYIMATAELMLYGMCYDFLPFMIYPIYNTLQKMDHSLIEAAYDLGANRREVFTKVILPLSKSGIYSGVVMVFMPTVSTFAISELLTRNKITLFGSLIQRAFGEGGLQMWNYGAALSLVLLLIIGLTSFFGNNDEQEAQSVL